MATKIPRRIDDLIDVDTSGVADQDALVYDDASGTWIPGAGGGGADDQTAAEVPVTPAGGIASTNVQAALEELDSEKASASSFSDHSARHEDGGADEISVAGLSGLLADAQTPLTHVHDGGDITTGTVADARIASTIARDSEVTSAIAALSSVYQPLDSDLTSIAALTTTSFGRGLLELANAAALLSAAGAVGTARALTAGDGLSGGGDLSADRSFAVNVDASTIEINADTLRVKASGITANEIATNGVGSAEIAAAAVTPAKLAEHEVQLLVSDPNGSAITTGDGKCPFLVPARLNGLNLVGIYGAVTTVSSSGIPTVQIRNETQTADMLTTKLTIDANEKTSFTAAAAAVIDTGNDDVATGDLLWVDIDVAGTGAKGLIVGLIFGP